MGGASNESVKRAKTIQKSQNIATHVLLSKYLLQNEHQISILEQMKNFRPSATIFEIGNTTKNDKIRNVMTEKRQMHLSVIDRYKQKKQIQDEPIEEEDEDQKKSIIPLAESCQDDIESTFKSVVHPKALTNAKVFEKKKKISLVIKQRITIQKLAIQC